MRPDPLVPNLFHSVSGKVALFKGGFCEIADADVEVLKKHPGYGYGKEFWTYEDLPHNEQQADELARLKNELAALKAATGKQVITVDRPVPVPTAPKDDADESDMASLRARAKELGIKAERTWRREDYERALLTTKEG